MKARLAGPLLLLCAAGAGCAHRPDCGAVARYEAESPELLECAAAAGDKLAQLELGIRYEEGRGVPRDLDRAERLYARAARSGRRSRYVYSAPVGGERYGRVIPVGNAGGSPGLAEARERLHRLRAARRRPQR